MTTYKKIRMNPQVLATMFIGFQRKLFTCPKEKDMFSVNESGGDCTIYFESSFWSRYLAELQDANNSGKFASSNAYSDWITLLSTIKSATNSGLADNCSDYYLGLKMFL